MNLQEEAAGIRFDRRPLGYEFERQTISLDDSIALTVRRPPKTTLEKGFWTPVGRWFDLNFLGLACPFLKVPPDNSSAPASYSSSMSGG